MNISAKPLTKSLTLLTLGLSMTVVATAWSQPAMRNGRPPQDRGTRLLGRMSDDLNLTAPQKARMKTIIDASITQARAINGKAGLSREQKSAQTSQIMRAMRTKLDGVLTPAQKQKKAALQAQADARQSTRRMASIDREAKLIGLSAQQTARMKIVAASAMKQRRALRDNATLQPEQRRAKNRQIAQATRTQMEAILTPAQRQKAAALRQQDRPGPGNRERDNRDRNNRMQTLRSLSPNR